EQRRAAVVAEDDDAPAEAADVRVPPCAAGLEPPLEHRARNVDRAGDDAVALAGALTADVDDQPARFRGLERLRWREPRDRAAGLGEELVERPAHPRHGVSLRSPRAAPPRPPHAPAAA